MSFFNLFKSKKTTPEVNPVKEVVVEESPVVVEKVLSEDEIAETSKSIELENDFDFIAIDCENANSDRYACAIGVAAVKNNEIVYTKKWLIRPPKNEYGFVEVSIHGITPEETLNCPGYNEIHSELETLLNGNIVVAHNYSTDRDILSKSADYYGLDTIRPKRWLCTYEIYDRKLNECALMYDIELKHHDPLSDAIACAKLLIASKNNQQPKFSYEEIKDKLPENKGYFETLAANRLKGDILASPDLSQIEDKTSIFYDKKIVITGTTVMPRYELAEALKELGADIQSGISKRTDIVVIGYAPGPSKMAKVEALNSEGAGIVIMADIEAELAIEFYYEDIADLKKINDTKEQTNGDIVVCEKEQECDEEQEYDSLITTGRVYSYNPYLLEKDCIVVDCEEPKEGQNFQTISIAVMFENKIVRRDDWLITVPNRPNCLFAKSNDGETTKMEIRTAVFANALKCITDMACTHRVVSPNKDKVERLLNDLCDFHHLERVSFSEWISLEELLDMPLNEAVLRYEIKHSCKEVADTTSEQCAKVFAKHTEGMSPKNDAKITENDLRDLKNPSEYMLNLQNKCSDDLLLDRLMPKPRTATELIDGQRFFIAGDFDKITRAEISHKIEYLGGYLRKTIGRNLTLVIKGKNFDSKLEDKLRKLIESGQQVTVMTEQDILAELDKCKI